MYFLIQLINLQYKNAPFQIEMILPQLNENLGDLLLNFA